MKIAQIIFLLFCLTCTIAGQETKWTRIEAENKEFSVSFPPNFIVDADTNDANQRYYITGFQNGVNLQLWVYKDENAMARLGSVTNIGAITENKTFKAEGFSGKNYVTNSKVYVHTIYLASSSYFYKLSVAASNSQKPEVTRFLRSIKLKKTMLFVPKDDPASKEEIISMGALKTSPEVKEALKRKSEKNEPRINYEVNSDLPSRKSDDSTRPAIVLVHPTPSSPLGLFPSPGNATIKLRYQLLANGQVGDITVYSNAERGIIKSFVEAIRKIKFIPAQKDGKPVDWEGYFIYNSQTFAMPPTL